MKNLRSAAFSYAWLFKLSDQNGLSAADGRRVKNYSYESSNTHLSGVSDTLTVKKQKAGLPA